MLDVVDALLGQKAAMKKLRTFGYTLAVSYEKILLSTEVMRRKYKRDNGA